MGLNVPLIVGGTAAAVGNAGGVLAERATHNRHERRLADREAGLAAGHEWINKANEHFADDIKAERTRDFDAKIEDYRLEHPAPNGVSYDRDGGWSDSVSLTPPDRMGLWASTVGAGLVGGGMMGGLSLAMASEATTAAGRLGGAITGAALLGIGGGVFLGSLVSNWTH